MKMNIPKHRTASFKILELFFILFELKFISSKYFFPEKN